MNSRVQPANTDALSSMRIEHSMLGTPDYEATLDWWTSKLGFTVMLEWTVPEFPGMRLAYIEKNGFIIEIVGQPGSFQNRAVPVDLSDHLSDPGFNHVAFVTENVDRVIAELESNGVETFFPATDFPDAGRRVAFIKDNQGNVIEFAQDLET